MKNFLLTLILLAGFSVYSQNILVADNNPGAPSGTHVYSTLQAAINAAVAGDIIHVIPSATPYDGTTTVNITKEVSIYGIGYFPDKDGPQVAKVTRFFVNASSVRISGLWINEYFDIGQDNGAYSGITIENCYVPRIFTGTGALTNILVRSCMINRANETSNNSIDFGTSVNNSVISNCVIDHYGSSTNYENLTAYNGTIIKNCIFLGHGNNAFGTLSNCTVSNSIFFGASPTASTTFTNNVLNNCTAVSYPTGANFDLGGYTGSNNVNTTTDSTIFVQADVAMGLNWGFSWDPNVIHPDLVGGGTDGNDIGIMGGTIPWSTTGTPLPLIQKLVVPEVIRQGENLNATIQAQGN